MWTSSNTETVHTPVGALWQRWINVASWPSQDFSLESASIDGDFAVDSHITLKPKGSSKVKLTIVEVTPFKSFSSIGKLPLAKLRFDHLAQPTGDGVSFTQTVTIDGPLSGLYAKFMGKKMATNLKARMTKLVELLQAG